MQLTLDIASEIYPISAGEILTLAVARQLVPEEMDVEENASLNGDGDGDAPKRVKREMWRSGDQGLAADYEYVMYGKVSRLDHGWRGIWLINQVYKFDDSLQGENQTCVTAHEGR